MKKFNIFIIAGMCCLAISCAKDEDPCLETVCYNNAPCISGNCQCPDGYSGADCSTEKTPTKVMLTKIIITRFPAFKSDNSNWDETSGVAPDLTLSISRAGANVYSSPAPAFEDASAVEDYALAIDPAVELNPIGQAYTIDLYDFDGAAGSGVNELMGSADFLPYHSGEGFPDVMEAGNNDVKFELHFTYVFE